MGDKLVRDPQAPSSALASLWTLQARSFGSLTSLSPSSHCLTIIGRAKRAPTLGCSIEISCDIYVSVCLSYVKLTAQAECKHAHAHSQPVLLFSTITLEQP